MKPVTAMYILTAYLVILDRIKSEIEKKNSL